MSCSARSPLLLFSISMITKSAGSAICSLKQGASVSSHRQFHGGEAKGSCSLPLHKQLLLPAAHLIKVLFANSQAQ